MRFYNHTNNRPSRRFLPLLLLGIPVQGIAQSPESHAPDRGYYVYVAAESEDRGDLVRFGPGGALDSRYAFVSVDVGKQAAGIVFWKADPS
jgi:hypothetical protein